MDSIFRVIDSSGDGTLSKDELKKALLDFGIDIDDKEIDETFKRLDTDLSEEIEYSEFIVAAMDEKVLLSPKNLQTAFKMFDLDGDNTISMFEIKTLLSYGSNTNN